MANKTTAWSTECIQTLAAAMDTINQMITDTKDELEKDLISFKSEDAFGPVDEKEGSEHMVGLADAFKALEANLEKVPTSVTAIATNIKKLAEVNKVALTANFKSTADAKDALAAARRKSAAGK